MKQYWLLGLIILIATFLRFYQLSSVPLSLNHDETALGYNAYAILKTGADEHGTFLPLSLKSFGDWKLPGYPVAAILPIAVFGLTEFAIRFPSAIAGITGVILVFLITKKLFKQQLLPFVAAILYVVSPWEIYFSRIAYETHLATTLFLLGLYLFLSYLERKSARLLIGSTLCLGVTLFTYHAFIIFVPLFTAATIFIWKDKLSLSKATMTSAVILTSFILVSIISTLQGGAQKASAVSIFSDKDVLYRRVEKLRGDTAQKNPTVERLLHSRFTGIPYEFAQNYVSAFSPTFLFDKGGEKLLHTTGEFGNFYILDAILLAAGFSAIFWKREKHITVLAAWLFIGLIPSAITNDAPSSTRLFLVLPLFVIVAAYGAYALVAFCLKRGVAFRLAAMLIWFLYLLNIFYFLDIYFVHMNFHRARFLHAGFKEVALLTKKYPNYKVVMKGPENFPYVSFLFYEQYDPKKFSKEVVYYPPTSEGLQFVKSFGRYSFVENVDSDQFAAHTIYIDDPKPSHGEQVIRLSSGDPIFGYTIVP